MIDWVMENKQWVFSGWGVAFITTLLGGLGSLIAWIFLSKKAKSSHKAMKTDTSDKGIHVQGDVDVKGDIRSIQGDAISAGGDITMAKRNGTAVSIKNSRVGVVGDNTFITGGIHFPKK